MNGPIVTTAIPELAPLGGAGRTPRRSPATHDAPAEPSPDVEIALADTLIRVHTLFRVDPTTNEVKVTVVDDEGQVVRMIPAESVAEMIAAMDSYPISR
jgi:FlaG protein